ncbi:MAG TPA: tetratricopeptide repeat protein [Candidatus Limnocylindria bacterium]|nr:tetratricopeptide repeat protein [Candidatus Limnocylindria bacterium]
MNRLQNKVHCLLAFTWVLVAGRPIARAATDVTYYRDVLPVFLKSCAGCHRPGQPAPFSLVEYGPSANHAHDIRKDTESRRMPPWLVDPVCGEFAGRRPLTESEIQLLARWEEEGAPAGDPAEAPTLPQWTEGWQGGKPDLVVKMPRPFPVPAGSRDIYRNFTIPVPLDRPRYVRAVEFRPGNPRMVHHAFVYVDSSGLSRTYDGRDGEPGYHFAMQPLNVKMPQGQFLTWQPGKQGPSGDAELPWLLRTNTDLVLALHLIGATNNQSAQCEVGLYFTDQAPRVTAFKLGLTAFDIDIPPLARDYVVEDTFTLPADAEAWAVLPHAHRLATTLEGWATLPDGTRRWLMRIPRWDFNWQGDYKYAHPLPLPKGTVLTMRYHYDNPAVPASGNGPAVAPARVRYGPRTSDEMAELWLQLILKDPKDLPQFEEAQRLHSIRLSEAGARARLAADPMDAQGNLDLGKVVLSNHGNPQEAEQHFRRAVAAAPENDQAHYFLGLVLRMTDRPAEARKEFEETIRINPDDYKAHGNLGLIAMERGDRTAAILHLETALKLNPTDQLCKDALRELNQRPPGQ